MNDSNGDGNGAGYVRFGPKDNQVMHPDTAEQLLTLWREKKPRDFGNMLAEVLTGVAPKGR